MLSWDGYFLKELLTFSWIAFFHQTYRRSCSYRPAITILHFGCNHFCWILRTSMRCRENGIIFANLFPQFRTIVWLLQKLPVIILFSLGMTSSYGKQMPTSAISLIFPGLHGHGGTLADSHGQTCRTALWMLSPFLPSQDHKHCCFLMPVLGNSVEEPLTTMPEGFWIPSYTKKTGGET